MTSVALERSSAFARQDNRPIEILTFSPDNSGKEREHELKAEGQLDDRVSIRNIWEDLGTWPDDKLSRMKGIAQPVPEAVDDALPHTSENTREERKDDDGTVLQTDHYTAHGRLMLIDRQDMNDHGTKSGRLLTLLNSQGDVVAQWRSATAFYKVWLNVIFGDDPSYVIVDSGYASSILRTYRKKNVCFCHVMHSHFLRNENEDARELSSGRFAIMYNADRFDRVITLTHAQQQDMLALNLSSGNLTVIPNVVSDLHGAAEAPRDKAHGIMLARLTKGKRIDGSSGFRVRDAVSDCRVLVMNEGRALGEDRSSSTRLSPKALSCNLPFLPRRVPSLMSFAALSSSASTSPALTSPMMTSLSSKPHYENLLGTAPSAVLKAGCVTT